MAEIRAAVITAFAHPKRSALRTSGADVVSPTCAASAYDCAPDMDLASVHDFLAAAGALHSDAGLANDRVHRCCEQHVFRKQQRVCRQCGVAFQVGMPAACGPRRGSRCALASGWMWPYANGAPGLGVNEYRGGLAEVDYAQGPPPHPASGSDRHAISETPIRFAEHQQALVLGPRHLQLQYIPRVQTHADPEDLTWAEPRVQRAQLVQERGEISHRDGASYACGAGRYGRNNQYGRRVPSGPGPGRVIDSQRL